MCVCFIPVCQVVVGVGHVDESLDHVGTLDEAEEHLNTHTIVRVVVCDVIK